ncbi:MAG: ABC transporter permease [Candidatus Cloacimonetes bacterium]|nr:ABC transporter permease [Candidatus Cloacimonadota bacterium]
MNHRLLIARKLLGGKGKLPLSTANILSLVGIAIGVFSIVVVSSVMNGFDNYMMESVINFKSDIWVTGSDNVSFSADADFLKQISAIKGVTGVSPVCRTDLMIQKNKVVSSVQCVGIDLKRHKEITGILEQIRVGNPDMESLEEGGVIIGLELSLYLRATVGEKIRLTSPLSTIPTPFGLVPRTRDFKVVGLFNAGLPEYDKSVIFIGLEQSRYFKGYADEVDVVEIKTDSPYTSRKVADNIGVALGNDYKVEDWSQFDSNLFMSIRMEKVAIMFVLSLMFLLVGFNMSGSFIKTITEKKRDIGILKAIGATDSDLARSVTFMAGIIGVVGTLAGGIAAAALMYFQQKFMFIKIPVPGFPLHSVPVEVHLNDVLLIVITAVGISLLSGWYPARKTLKMKPISMIRNLRD